MVAYLALVTAAAAADLAGALLVATVHQKGLAPLRYFVAGGAGFMLAGGQSRAAAIGAGALLGVLTIAGATATSLLAGHYVGYALALSAGVTIYVAASDLIPEVNREGGPALGWTVFAGLLLFVIADWLVSPLGGH